MMFSALTAVAIGISAFMLGTAAGLRLALFIVNGRRHVGPYRGE